MGSRGQTACGSNKALCVYIAEAGDNGVHEEVIQLIRQCVQDKIFAASCDKLCVARDDEIDELSYSELSWDLIRNVETSFRNPRQKECKRDPLATLAAALQSVAKEARKDTYSEKKILMFGQFINPLSKNEIEKLKRDIINTQTFVSIVFPDKKLLTEIQEANYNLLENMFESVNFVFMSHFMELCKVLKNTLSKKIGKAMAWNVAMEIGPALSLNVQGFSRCRANTKKDLQTALENNVKQLELPKGIQSASGPGPSSSSSQIPTQNQAKTNDSKPDIVIANVVPLAEVAQTEKIWSQLDGTKLDESDLIKAYIYGDRLVPFDEIDKENDYKTGGNALKVLFFTTKDKISPCHMLGTGADYIFPKKEPESELKYDALYKAMLESDKVAIVRKVRYSNGRVQLGVIAADDTLQCLVYTEIAFADDIAHPYFPPLVKETGEDEEEGISEKDNLIDDFIMNLTIDEFTPENGPVDPTVQQLRDIITKKIIGIDCSKDAGIGDEPNQDNIDAYFDNINLSNEILEKMKEMFPLRDLQKEKYDKKAAAATDVFRKRLPGDSVLENEETKKVKLEEDLGKPNYELEDGVQDPGFLYAFDFDHTIIDGNSDVDIPRSLLQKNLPPEIENIYDGTNWTAYMDKVMEYLAEQGFKLEDIKTQICQLKFVPGMEKLLNEIRVACEQNSNSRLIVLSDANTYFIETALQNLVPPITPHAIFTNKSNLPCKDGPNHLEVKPFHNQSNCQICPSNLCKGSVLSEYVQKEGPFKEIYYIGDGQNDSCPALRLGSTDTLFVRKGYSLEKVIAQSRVPIRKENGQKGYFPIQLNAKVTFFETADIIMSSIKY